MIVRADSLVKSMSRYLIDQIEKTPNIQLWTHAEVIEVHGETHLEEISVQCSDTNTVERVPASAMFIYIGALPRTDWLDATAESLRRASDLRVLGPRRFPYPRFRRLSRHQRSDSPR